MLTYSLFLKTRFVMKAPHKQGMDTVRAGLLNISEQEENVGEDCLAHVFWGVLDKSCRHFSNWHVTSHLWMCQSQDIVLEEEQQQHQGISKWDLSANIKVDGNLLRDIRHMCP